MAYGKAIQYRTGGMCLQSISGNTPAKGDVVSLGRKCAEGWDASRRVFTFPHPGKQFSLHILTHTSSSYIVNTWSLYFNVTMGSDEYISFRAVFIE